jgi:hypothetical protein
MNRRLGNVIVVLTSLLTLFGCSKNNTFEDCRKIKALSDGPYFISLGGQDTFKSLIISNYVNYKDEEIKKIIKSMLIENDLDALTVNNSFAIYCQQKGIDYFNLRK